MSDSPLSPELEATIAEAVDALDRCVMEATLNDDQLRFPLMALSAFLKAQRRLYVDASLTLGRQIKGAQPVVMDKHVDRMSRNVVDAFNPRIARALKMLQWKTMARFLAFALLLIGATGAGGYYYGYMSGFDASQSKLVSIKFGDVIGPTMPAPMAEMWFTLMRYNAIEQVWGRCAPADQNGGEFCNFPFWVKPPPAKAQ